MKHVIILVIKYLLAAAVFGIMLGNFTDLGIRQILLTSLVVTVVTYLMGDLLILSIFNNTIAAVADAGLCWLIIYLANYAWPESHVPLISALSAAAVLGLAEMVLHPYIERNILRHSSGDPNADIVR